VEFKHWINYIYTVVSFPNGSPIVDGIFLHIWNIPELPKTPGHSTKVLTWKLKAMKTKWKRY